MTDKSNKWNIRAKLNLQSVTLLISFAAMPTTPFLFLLICHLSLKNVLNHMVMVLVFVLVKELKDRDIPAIFIEYPLFEELSPLQVDFID